MRVFGCDAGNAGNADEGIGLIASKVSESSIYRRSLKLNYKKIKRNVQYILISQSQSSHVPSFQYLASALDWMFFCYTERSSRAVRATTDGY